MSTKRPSGSGKVEDEKLIDVVVGRVRQSGNGGRVEARTGRLQAPSSQVAPRPTCSLWDRQTPSNAALGFG